MHPNRQTRVPPSKKRLRPALKAFETSSQTFQAQAELRLRTTEASAPEVVVSLNLPGEASKTHLPQLAALREMVQSALSFCEASMFLPLAAQLVATTLGTERAGFLELSTDGLSLKLQAGSGWEEGAIGKATLDAGCGSEARFILDSGTPVVFEGPLEEGRIFVTS
jgi:hypothetical protein